MIRKSIYDEFINKYSLQKTIRFSLIPVNETLNYIEKNGIIGEDEDRAYEYIKLKKLCDRVHKEFIEDVLSNLKLDSLDIYEELYNIEKKTDSDKKKFEKIQVNLREQISKSFTKNKNYNDLFNKNMINKKLIELFKSEEENLNIIKNFSKFTTYLTGFHENRKNMYSKEEKGTAIAYRLINENLPKFIDNIKIFMKLKDTSIENEFLIISNELDKFLNGLKLQDVFKLENFNSVLTQEGIDNYNSIIGGYSRKNGEKIKGLNEYINLYNQITEKNKRIPKLKPLFKQILSDESSKSFIYKGLENDNEVLEVLKNLHESLEKEVINSSSGISILDLFNDIENYDLSKIYIKNDASITNLSQRIFGDWSLIKEGLILKYDDENKNVKSKKYEEDREKYINNRESFSIEELNRAIDYLEKENSEKIDDIYLSFKAKESEKNYIEEVYEKYNLLKDVLEKDYDNKKGLVKDTENIKLIKDYLDKLNEMKNFVKPLLGSGKEAEKDEKFYSELERIWKSFGFITAVYNKVRNYITKKPYITEKIKLNFKNPQLLAGWTANKEVDRSSIMFKDNNFYYLGIINTTYNSEFKEYKKPKNKEDVFLKMNYLQAGDPSKDIQNIMIIDGKIVKKNGKKSENGENLVLEELKNKYLPKEINRIRKTKSYSKSSESFNKEDLNMFIEFYKEMAIGYYSNYNFKFYETEKYDNFKAFTDHINMQAYQINFIEVSKEHIYNLVSEGKLYLFKIYNKDFSEYSKGTPNLHTLYWEMLFDTKNLENVVYKLNGQAEIFFRKRSIPKDKIISHKKHIPIKNKNLNNNKRESVFDYDLIKDKRYTVDKFLFNVPITMNFSAEEVKNINSSVNLAIKKCDDIHIIGIDRGERNLIYISVIDSSGKIIKQKSFNIIESEYKGNKYKVDYHNLLENKESSRDNSRKNWQTIKNIKEIKEGYLSQVIHEIIKLMIQYNAIVVLEDLNFGFKRGRQKFEISVYQKFEKMLIDKLNFLVDKKGNPENFGGLLKAYQLTNKFESFKSLGKQSGFLYYVNAWNTSKIDPTTGFVNLLSIKYKNINDAKEFINKFDDIRYNLKEKYFEFDIDYSKFNKQYEKTRRKWTLYSYGERIVKFRDKNINSKFNVKEIDIKEEFTKLFEEYDVDYKNKSIKESIQFINDKEFFERLLKLIRLMLQTRNTGVINNGDIEKDYIISPVKNEKGEFYKSKINDEFLPKDADANGAYNIARKGLIIVKRLRETRDEDIKKVKLNISNGEWLRFVQGLDK